MFVIYRVFLVLLDEDRKVLYGSDDDSCISFFQLTFEDGRRGVAVGSPPFETVILLHRLIVEVFAVNDKQHLVDKRQFCSQLSRFEGGESLSASCGMPDVATALYGAIFLIVVRDIDFLQNAFCSHNLVGAHHEEQLLTCEDTVFGQNVQQGVFGEESAGKVSQVGDRTVSGIRPPGSKLKRVTGFLTRLTFTVPHLPDMGITCCVTVIFSQRTVTNHEELNIFIESASSPERITLI